MHRHLVGSAILDRLDETFGQTDARIPKFVPSSRPPTDIVLSAVSQLTKLFLINGYAWEGKAFVSNNSSANSKNNQASGTQFTISLTAPANIWSGQALQVRSRTPGGGDLNNSFLLTAAKELVTRMGYTITSSSVSYEGTKEISTFTIQ